MRATTWSTLFGASARLNWMVNAPLTVSIVTAGPGGAAARCAGKPARVINAMTVAVTHCHIGHRPDLVTPILGQRSFTAHTGHRGYTGRQTFCPHVTSRRFTTGHNLRGTAL